MTIRKKLRKRRRVVVPEPMGWLRKEGAWWSSKVTFTRTGVVEGIGCVALRPLGKNVVFCRIPKSVAVPFDSQRTWVCELETLPPFPQHLFKGTELEGATRPYRVSHANPWFGGSIVPFCCHINYGPVNCRFEQRGDTVVGITTKRVFGELFQEYASSTADFILNYGFAPTRIQPDDVVSIPGSDLTTATEACHAALLLEDNTVQVGLRSGLAKLVGCALVGPKFKQDHEDIVAANLVATVTQDNPALYLKLANVGEGNDPWPALIFAASQRHRNLVEDAVTKARDALNKRKNRLLDAPFPSTGDRAWQCAAILRHVELRILATADRRLRHALWTHEPFNLN